MAHDVDTWLEDFVAAHERDFQQALGEIRAGRKATHWMWYIFPQVNREGASGTAVRYSVPSIEHAMAFLCHPTLGANYLAITREARMQLEVSTRPEKVLALFEHPDHLKFVSSVTLMGEVARRAGLTTIAYECETSLALAYADGMSECEVTKSFLGGLN